jgi:glucosamine-6-phosphate deaminase
VTFNLDEYYPMAPDSIHSYHRFMFENFFDHVNIDPKNVHIPRGDLSRDEIDDYCADYERAIRSAGGIDLLLLGIGRSGHIGFNEPGSAITDRTRLIVLDEITRKDAASDFFEERYVPREAITMGVGTILEAREVILMATGEHKAPIIRRAVEKKPNPDVTASFLQSHADAAFYLDRAAAGDLTREKTPWLVRPVEWDDAMAKKAIIWLSDKTKKPIQWLDASDFHRNHLHDLVHINHLDELCQRIFEDLRRRIKYRRDLPKKQRVIVFSPHPDDDVISMGGMLRKLVENGNEIIVAYMTNGSVAVFDSDVRRHLQFIDMAGSVLVEGGVRPTVKDRIEAALKFLDDKEPAQVDTDEVQKIKALIRYSEAIAALEVMGMDGSNALFMDLPFYKTGRVKKDPVGEEDVQIILDLFRECNPQHLFVAGDLSDPHGTHRMCYSAIKQAVERYNEETGARQDGEETGKSKSLNGRTEDGRPEIWLYRGAWQEWEIDVADVFVPLSKADLDLKIEAIFKHESQKDRALFPGAYDDREFWERAQDRNRETANELDLLGLPAFYAAEAYVKTKVMP